MRTFFKNLSITAVAILAIVSFIRWDINVADWDNSGRFIFTVAVLFIACITSAVQEEESKSN
jgi:hypothetical protein